MNILITGLHGFVGSNLVLSLKDSHVLYGLDIIFPKVESVMQTYSWDDINEINLSIFDVIIHLAGKAHDTKNQSIAKSYFDINTGLTQKIFDYFLKSSAKKFIFFSSIKAAADTADGVLTEEITPKPLGPYGESKILAERYIQDQFKEYKGNNRNTEKQVYILRPAMIHGPGNKGNLNLLYAIVNKGIPWPLGAFENKRSFTSIDNLSYIIDELIKQDITSGVYNIADDAALSTNELIKIICDVMNKKCRIWNVNKGIVKTGARLGTLLHLPLNQERLKKLTENYIVSNVKIKKAIGIENLPIQAEDGLRKTIQSFGL